MLVDFIDRTLMTEYEFDRWVVKFLRYCAYSRLLKIDALE